MNKKFIWVWAISFLVIIMVIPIRGAIVNKCGMCPPAPADFASPPIEFGWIAPVSLVYLEILRQQEIAANVQDDSRYGTLRTTTWSVRLNIALALLGGYGAAHFLVRIKSRRNKEK